MVQAKLLPIPGKADTVTLKLDPIIMTDLGSDDKMDVAKLTGKILLAIATGVAKQGVGLLPDSVTDAMGTTLGITADVGKAAHIFDHVLAEHNETPLLTIKIEHKVEMAFD